MREILIMKYEKPSGAMQRLAFRMYKKKQPH